MYGSTASSEPLSGKTRRLVTDSRQVIAESEELGGAVLGQLQDQRDSIVNTQGRIADVHGLTGQTRKALIDMDRKACLELACLYATIAALVVLICLVVVREITNSGKLL